ncbi:SAVED domain-containing protein [Stigmatella sp. ncwal1]|uniref:SAVED domain-containing protein n=1 Tax=Stigmatella ashevillensis TaxID=2995309 RepID=A0ABT5D7H8_9BACT|nr:SAVED domain-containing protein [Stigmatella ashevillena]MDC0709619.1 SAVED domain-containing protein [Stigmatella ashevillena]
MPSTHSSGNPGRPKKAPSPVVTRKVPPDTKLRLAVAAGGRCEFRGCNLFLYEHHITGTGGNFAEAAHIVGFREGGPRGDDPGRPEDIHALENLLLLCPNCHKLIDDRPEEFPRLVLEAHKREHEERIHQLTGLGPHLQTVVVQFKSRIHGQSVEIPLVDVRKAVAPRYPVGRKPYLFDLTVLSDDGDSFYAAAQEVLRRDVRALYAKGTDVDAVRHISLFALAPIPLLVALGAQLSNKIPVELFQRHRDTQDWVWKTEGTPAQFSIHTLRNGTDPTKVAIVLPLSGPIAAERLPTAIDGQFTVYEISLEGQPSGTDFLRTRNDLIRFEATYRQLLSMIVGAHPSSREIHLFCAVPAPIAIACGHQILPKAQPALIVYDHVAVKGGFVFCLRIDQGHD